MKLQKNKEEKSQVLGASMAKEFSIDTSNQMIVSILRDKLYANKIAAVCREVASNSRDANREAGRADVPVVITITEPNSLLSNEGLQISFKDSGIGISPERIENVFLKYGSSTKRSTNNQTGGFGIGAKTPFAYSKEFLVSTVSEHEGKLMKHIYQAIILNNDGVESSQLILVSDEVTDEPTGTEIIVPIDRNDRDDFEHECIKATTLWEEQPELVGVVTRHSKIKNLKKD
jgi:DNA topoisomerase VI subunit B